MNTLRPLARAQALSDRSGSIDVVTLILLYLVVLILVAVVLFGVGSVLFGRGERLPPLPRATTATVLPASGVTGADVEAVKFTQVAARLQDQRGRLGAGPAGPGARPAAR